MKELGWTTVGELFVVGRDASVPDAVDRWIVLCACDTVSIVAGVWLRKQALTICKRCSRKKNPRRATIHGFGARKHPMAYLYRAYRDAVKRCSNPNNKDYKYYGGRGIQVQITLEDWFAELGPRPDPTYSVDRIDNNRHYEKGNLRWASRAEQNLNRRKLH